MLKSIRCCPPMGWLVCAVVGIAAGFAAGVWWSSGSSDAIVLPPAALEAVATDSSDVFTIATGPVGADVEGVFLLDQVTGDLQCLVMGRRAPNGVAQFVAQFKKNVYQDLQIAGAKKSKLLMVTGTAAFMGSTRNTRLANAVVYIVDGATGRFAAYGMPWNNAAYSSGQPQVAPFITMAVGSVRQPDQIRE